MLPKKWKQILTWFILWLLIFEIGSLSHFLVAYFHYWTSCRQIGKDLICGSVHLYGNTRRKNPNHSPPNGVERHCSKYEPAPRPLISLLCSEVLYKRLCVRKLNGLWVWCTFAVRDWVHFYVVFILPHLSLKYIYMCVCVYKYIFIAKAQTRQAIWVKSEIFFGKVTFSPWHGVR